MTFVVVYKHEFHDISPRLFSFSSKQLIAFESAVSVMISALLGKPVNVFIWMLY